MPPAYIVGWLNSALTVSLIHIQANAYEFNTGIIKSFPWRYPGNAKDLAALAHFTICKVRELRTLEEINSLFTPAVAQGPQMMASHKRTMRNEVAQSVRECQSRWDEAMGSAYGVGPLKLDAGVDEAEASANDDPEEDDEAEESDNLIPDAARTMVSHCLGHAFGRWDLRYATGEKPAPELPDPFAPLPVCPPGMLQNAQGLPARPDDVPATYPIRIPWDGILVDDPNHPLDIERRVREVIEIIWKDRAEAIEHEACEILGVQSLRDYFRKPAGFFADHLKRYSKSRRQAPIYWPLSTASGGYTLWIYYHRLTDQTLYAADKHVGDKIADVTREIGNMERDLGSAAGRTASQLRDRLSAAQELLAELTDLREELLRVAALPWKPNLNDGVIITAAPLHKLFRHRQWARDTKEVWESLAAGEYDWAHLAYTIWPDRVREKCKTDRSLAIAHGLEDLYQAPPPQARRRRGRRQAAEDADEQADQ